MKDRYSQDLREGDVVRIINQQKNPYSPMDKIFLIERISQTLSGTPCLYVEGVDTILFGDDVELYAVKVD